MSEYFSYGYEMGLYAATLDNNYNQRFDYSKTPSKYHMRLENSKCNPLYSLCYTCEYYNKNYHLDSGDYSHKEIHHILMEILTSVKLESDEKRSVKITKPKRTRNRVGNRKNISNTFDQLDLLEATFMINKSPTKAQILDLLKELLLIGFDDTNYIIKLKKHNVCTVSGWFRNKRIKNSKNTSR
jgi:hypothetical protein